MYACYFVYGKQLNELRTLFSDMLWMQLRNAIPFFGEKNAIRRTLQLGEVQLTDAN